MDIIIDCEQEDDGRWLARLNNCPVCLHGSSPNEAMAKAKCCTSCSCRKTWHCEANQIE